MMVQRMMRKIYRKVLGWSGIPLRRILSRKNTRSGKAFIVIGAESAGTRMLTRFLIGCGCKGDGDHQQIFDYENPSNEVTLLVWRRSVPHEYMKHPNIVGMCKLLKHLGYRIVILRIYRNPRVTLLSQVRNGHAKDMSDAKERFHEANRWMNKILRRVKFDSINVQYEEFVKNKKYRKSITEHLGIPYREVEKYDNRNIQYNQNT